MLSVRRRKMAVSKLTKISRKMPEKSGKMLLLNQMKVVFIVVVNTHILQLALHRARPVGLTRRLDILQVPVILKVNQNRWLKKLYWKFNSLI